MFIYIFSIARERCFGGTVFFLFFQCNEVGIFKNLLRISRRDRFVFVLCFDHERFLVPAYVNTSMKCLRIIVVIYRTL